MSKRVDWTTLKGMLDARGLTAQYIEFGGEYWIKAIDGPFELETTLTKHSPTPVGSDQEDFEDNYKSLANDTPKTSVIRHLGQDELSLSPRALFVTGTKGTDIVVSKVLNSTTGLIALRGGCFHIKSEKWTYKDTVSAKVVDDDNVLGYGAGFVVAEYIPTWNDGGTTRGEWAVMPDVINNLIDESVSDALPNGLYFKATYHSDASATVDPQGLVDIIAYEV